MNGDRGAGAVPAVKARARRAAGNGQQAEATPAELEKLAADIVRQIGAKRARYVAALLEEAADAAEAEGKG
jgi:hypothetical protein